MKLLRSRGAPLVFGLARDLSRREQQTRAGIRALATRMGKVLAEVEDRAWADARPCPICHASANGDVETLPHAPGCELDAVLVEGELRRPR